MDEVSSIGVWPIFSLLMGRLIDECGYEGSENWPLFHSENEAQTYLLENNIRGTVV